MPSLAVQVVSPDPNAHGESETDRLLSSPLDVTDTRTSISDDRQFAKDTRSYEHSRHRLKEAMSFVKRRARKECKASATAAHIPPLSSEKEKRLRPDDVDPMQDVEPKINKDHLALRTTVFMGGTEVKLLDLITTKRQRKVKERDFEVIPRVRSVIVLDDFSEPDSEVDESWEHIHKEDKQVLDSVRKPSYAEIVAFTK